jgi:hypothetical protein
MPTFQNLNERGNISRYEYDKINLGQTGKFYADDQTPFTTAGGGSVSPIESISDEGSGLYEVTLPSGTDTSDFVVGAKLRVYTTEKVANAICEIVGVDGVVVTVSCNTDISQTSARGFAEYHPFYGGWEIQALGDTVLAFEEEKAFGNKPATINLADGDTIKARRISSVTVTSGVAAISLL